MCIYYGDCSFPVMDCEEDTPHYKCKHRLTVKMVGKLREERDRLLVLATKWCDESHQDWDEILRLTRDI